MMSMRQRSDNDMDLLNTACVCVVNDVLYIRNSGDKTCSGIIKIIYYGYSQGQRHRLWSIQRSATVWPQLTQATSYNNILPVGKLYDTQEVIPHSGITIVQAKAT